MQVSKVVNRYFSQKKTSAASGLSKPQVQKSQKNLPLQALKHATVKLNCVHFFSDLYLMKFINRLLPVFGLIMGALAVISGEADDSPGLQGLGLALILWINYRFWKKRQQTKG